MTKALVVLSGGQDSTICLFWAKHQYDEVTTITFDYFQRHNCEIRAAKKIAELAQVPNELIKIGNILKSSSPLTSNSQLETYQSFEQMDKTIGDRVELTFVPGRNDLFLTIAYNRAVAEKCNVIVTGVCQADNANYPDCREDYIEHKMTSSNWALGTELVSKGFIDIQTPLMNLSKAQSIKLAFKYEGCYTALAYSHTSYSGEYPPVTQDHATVLRAHGFVDAGVPDPLIVRTFLEYQIELLPQTRNYQDYKEFLEEWRESLGNNYRDSLYDAQLYDCLLALEEKVRKNMNV